MSKTRQLDARILLRVTRQERARIHALAKERRLSTNDYLRAQALGVPIKYETETETLITELTGRIQKLEETT